MTNATDRWGLDSLDGLMNTLISHQIDGWEVMIGGGPDIFVLTAQTANATRVVNALSDGGEGDMDDEDTVDLTVGGQVVDYPRQYILDRTQVLTAIDDIIRSDFPAERWEILGED